MTRRVANVFLAVAALLVLVPAALFAQEGQIAGTVRDPQNSVMPGVTVEVTSPALIEKLRTTITDSNGQYRITNLPVGTYKVTFSLEGFTKHERDDIVVTSNFTAPVSATMSVGQVTETVLVTGMTPVVDVQNSREVINWPGEQIRNMPTSRNVNSLLQLTAGIGSQYTTSTSQSPFGAPGVCVGGVGVFCSPNINGFNLGDTGTALDQTNMAQGRVLVDGQVVNSGGTVPIFGQTGGYVSDIANSQEVNVRVSGALGESETGGSEINIVPRTGGNRYAGDFYLTYATEKWFDTNNGNYPGLPAAFQPVKKDHDESIAFGGPIKRDKLWFYAATRNQFIHKLPVGVDFWPNLWEGVYGYNYQPDRDQSKVEYTNHWRNVNARITWQATAKNKFNIFWDEQDSCQDPCTGVVSVSTSPESWFSPTVQPNRVQYVNWTNPLTSKILLEAGLNVTTQLYKTDAHQDYTNYVDIPRISETCSTGACTVGGDATSPRVNVFAGGAFFPLTSGSINNEVGGLAERRDLANYRTRASLSYVTGGHHAKFGYDGGYYSQDQINKVNNLQQTWNYVSPATTANCAIGQCGNTSLQFPSDPLNTTRRPVPNTVDYNTGSTTLVDHVRYSALYAQDLWTLKRITVGAALRYDHATSGYGESCFGPNQFVLNSFCVASSDGVSYNDVSPRWSVGWDVRGNGRTAIKWNMGKYNNAAGISGIYSATNPSRRTVNLLRRNWTDTNGNRRVDCDLMNFAPNGECTTGFAPFAGFTVANDTTRFGRDPLGLDAAGNPVGLQTTQCGRTEQGIPAAVQAYCNQYGDSLIDGWGRRRGEWQFDLGVQHEILPRLSAEVVYHRRNYSNLTVTDQIGVGCDRFNGVQDQAACNDALLNYTSQSYDFFSVAAPTDPRLPGGGGYRILGLYDSKPTLGFGQPSAQTFWDARNYHWDGFDVNFNYRGPQGIFAQAGTGTSRTRRDTCNSQLDPPSVRGREGAEYRAGCLSLQPWRTTVRGSITYVVPKIDILVSSVFQSLPGAEQTAQFTFSKDQVTWGTASRATLPCPPPPPGAPSNGVGCFFSAQGGTLAQPTATTVPVQLLLSNELFGERVTTFDVKVAKNIRFSGRRLNVGVDVYNVVNSDAISSYNSNFVIDNPATEANENTWLQPMGLVSPRFLRLQIQFNF
jgi:hypothetical protein